MMMMISRFLFTDPVSGFQDDGGCWAAVTGGQSWHRGSRGRRSVTHDSLDDVRGCELGVYCVVCERVPEG